VFGGGSASSSDGQFFRAGGFGRDTSSINAHYGEEPGVKFYTHLSDRYAPFHTKVIAATASEAAHVLDGLLYHQSEVRNLPAAAAIETAAKRLDQLRNGWLYPVDLVTQVPESASGFPARTVSKDKNAARMLAGRTLTALYNDRPDWLVEAHRLLDEAVAAAYGWPADIAADEALRRLLELNLTRSTMKKRNNHIGQTTQWPEPLPEISTKEAAARSWQTISFRGGGP
jgi:hypothetical protein